MSEDCGVCLDPGDYDAPVFYNERVVKARKPHVCCECSRQIEVGRIYQKVSGKWDGDFNEYHTCIDCMWIRDAFACGGGFLFTTLWDDLYQYRHDVNTGCVAKIKTVTAKQYYMDWLRKVRGIGDPNDK